MDVPLANSLASLDDCVDIDMAHKTLSKNSEKERF